MSTQQRLERAWSPFMLYLGNLPYSMGDHELANICSHHGNLSDLFVVTDKFSGRSKGFAFAKFAEDKAAVAARAALDGLEMDGRQIHVSFARDPDRERRSAQPTPVVVDYGLALVDGALEPVEVQSDGQRNVAEGWQTDHVYLYIIESGRAARLRDELEELVYLVSNPATREEELQALFEQHRWLLLGTQYKDLHPKVRLERGEAGPLIPDFVLEPSVPPAYGDILDLKRPQERVLVGPNGRRRLAASVTRALAQIDEYTRYFADPANKQRFLLDHGLRMYRPRGLVVIGRDPADVSPEEFQDFRRDNPHVWTYDDVIRSARVRVSQAT